MKIDENDAFGEKKDIYFCNDCELYFMGSAPSQEKLLSYYRNDTYTGKFKYHVLYILKSFCSRLRSYSQFLYIKSLVNDFKNVNTVLEIGSYDGTFLSFFKKKGIRVFGFEYNEKMKKMAYRRFKIKLESKEVDHVDDNYPKFNLIAFPHSLEHMREPIAILNHCKKLLAKSGYIFVELPMSPLPLDAHKDILHDYLNTVHLYNFTDKSLMRLARKCGFKVVDISKYGYKINPFFRKYKKEIANNFVHGKLLDLKILPLLIITLFLNLVEYTLKQDPLERIKLNTKWEDKGANLRIVLQK